MNKSADWQDIKHRIISRAPTQQAKRAIWCLLLGAPVLCGLVGFLNPITLELNSKQLTWLQIYIALFLVFATSVYLNFHLYFKLISLGRFIDESLTEMAEKYAQIEIQSFKNKHNIP
ncbi:hypothetical protein [Methylophilus sp. TWE2]|uniref:hypothetical protein n=1 Tax=Methylophilus sp. TWE2 TaxID=1662285 RepID=UPI00067126D1|nr:hypothetical protein [Methylophilus sp. TWE2]AKR43178.1 hypothetical protein ACJ67_06875 [Methylophilus sp. TWE2]